MNTRGPRKLCSVTYVDLAKWTGLSVGTVRNRASAKEFDRNDLDSLIRWVNVRRAAKGLPAIGGQVDYPQQPATSPDSCGYDPRTAEYR